MSRVNHGIHTDLIYPFIIILIRFSSIYFRANIKVIKNIFNDLYRNKNLYLCAKNL